MPEEDGYKVFVVDVRGTAVARDVEIGGRTATKVEITKGLSGGETVVTKGAFPWRTARRSDAQCPKSIWELGARITANGPPQAVPYPVDSIHSSTNSNVVHNHVDVVVQYIACLSTEPCESVESDLASSIRDALEEA